KLQERLILQRLAGQIDREAPDVLADRRAVRAQQFAGAAHHPAVDSRHQLITLRRGEELARWYDFPALAQHADQQFESRPPIVAAQRKNRLGVEPEAVVAQGVAQI